MRSLPRWSLALVIGAGACNSPTIGDEASDSTEGTTSPAPGRCEQPESLVQPGPSAMPSGYQRCEDGFTHRTQAIQCDLSEASGSCDDAPMPADACTEDADCDDEPLGYCNARPEFDVSCACSYACTSDADCAADEACHCEGASSRCIPATCRTDADCPGDERCGLTERIGACGSVYRELSCTGPADECLVDDECGECMQCLVSPATGTRFCQTSGPGCLPCG